MDHVIAAPPTSRAWCVLITWHQLSRDCHCSSVSTIMATQEEKQALLGPSTPPVNPASSLPASAPEYEEPPPYTEGPAGPCKLCLKHCKTMVLYSLCNWYLLVLSIHTYMYPLILFSYSFLSFLPSSLLPLSLLSCRHESAYRPHWFRSSSTTIPGFSRPDTLCPVPSVSTGDPCTAGDNQPCHQVCSLSGGHRECIIVTVVWCVHPMCVCVCVCVCVVDGWVDLIWSWLIPIDPYVYCSSHKVLLIWYHGNVICL